MIQFSQLNSHANLGRSTKLFIINLDTHCTRFCKFTNEYHKLYFCLITNLCSQFF